MRVLDLFSGIGGFSLGLERAGMKTVAFCEIDPFCRRVLRKHWPEVPIHNDIRNLDGREYGPDIICGGYPCQPFSTASRGRRVAPDFWPNMLAVIERCRPQYVLCENVSERAQHRAAANLRGLGYRTDLRRISGDDLGADHTRNRWWACAYSDKESELFRAVDDEVAKLPALCRGVWCAENYTGALRVPDGLPNRLDRCGALGNAVFPQIPEAYGRALLRSFEEAP